jgi:hypothetical protein
LDWQNVFKAAVCASARVNALDDRQVDSITAFLIVPEASNVSYVRASIWAGSLQASQPVNDTVSDRLALSAQMPAQWSPDNVRQYVTFTLVGGPVLLAPGSYTARLEHVSGGTFNVPFTDFGCTGMAALSVNHNYDPAA